MVSRAPGRILLLGVAGSSVVGEVLPEDSPAARELRAILGDRELPVLAELDLVGQDTRAQLLAELCRIHCKDWIRSKQLDSTGALGPCEAQNCGGFTLEAELGIPKNSKSEPDFLGWEVKQHKAPGFKKVYGSARITLMTPEPDGGFYHHEGVERFVRRFGYPDKSGRPDRLNFGGIHLAGQECKATKLGMRMRGFDPSGKIADVTGAVELVDSFGDVAASWSFGKFLEHWSKKHSKAVYVPCQRDTSGDRCYRYGNLVRLAVGTNPLLLLKAISEGVVYYDPGIKVMDASSADPDSKARSQFRVSLKNIGRLYSKVEIIDVCSGQVVGAQ
jgi:hypothetical protein